MVSDDEQILLNDDEITITDPINALNAEISRIGMGSYQYKLFMLCGAGWAADQMYLNAPSILLPQIRFEYSLNGWLLGLASTSVILGAMLGAMGWGYIADQFGRKPVFHYTLLIAATGALVSAFAFSYPILCIGLFLSGLGIGGNLPIDGTLFLEFVPTENQSYLTLLSLFWPLGQVLMSVMSWITMPSNSCDIMGCDWKNNIGWRYLMLCLALVTIIMIILRNFYLKFLESPKNLVSRGEPLAALKVLNQLAERNHAEGYVRVEAFELEIQDLEFEETGWNAYKPLFSKELRVTTILITLIWISIAVGYTLFNAFLPALLKTNQDSMPSSNSFLEYFIISMFGIPGSFAGMYFIDSRLGRKGSMASSALLTAISLVLVSLSESNFSRMVYSGLVSFFQNAMYGVIYSYTPEVFPTNVRGKGVGIASAASKLIASLAPLAGGSLLLLGPAVPVIFASAFIFVGTILMLLLPIETRGMASM